MRLYSKAFTLKLISRLRMFDFVIGIVKTFYHYQEYIRNVLPRHDDLSQAFEQFVAGLRC